MKSRTALSLAFAVLSVDARAGEVCHSRSFAQASTSWSQSATLPKHDPAVGALQSVTVTVRASFLGSLDAENPAAQPGTYEARIAASCTIRRPDASPLVAVEPDATSTLDLGAWDGTLDFGGTSGASLHGLQSTRELHVVLASPADLALFTAASGSEQITLGVTAQGSTTASGPGALITSFAVQAGVDVTVCYGFREIRQTVAIPAAPTSWHQTVGFAKHDPTLGPLRSVRLRCTATMSGAPRIESFEALPAAWFTDLRAVARVERPDASVALATSASAIYADYLSAFDGVLDFGGTSGVSHATTVVVASSETTLDRAADLALFTASSPGETIQLGVQASGESVVVGPGAAASLLSTTLGVELQVLYDRSAPVVLECFGDGSWVPCPCGNSSPIGAQQGCANSSGLGAELRASGYADLGDDTLAFTVANLPPFAPVLLFQGTGTSSTTFGDGLRCVGGTIVRLGTGTSIGGVATFPPAGPPISALGLVTPGSTRHYQGCYRNNAPFCGPGRFNLTNGMRIDW